MLNHFLCMSTGAQAEAELAADIKKSQAMPKIGRAYWSEAVTLEGWHHVVHAENDRRARNIMRQIMEMQEGD